MKLIIEIDNSIYDICKSVRNLPLDENDIMSSLIMQSIANGTPISDNATNGQVLLQMFPPSVYFGDDEKHIVLLAKDCELTCYNNEWWNAPYKAEGEDCRNCKKWEDCPCGKDGHENGTSQGYSIGECRDFKPQAESEVNNG